MTKTQWQTHKITTKRQQPQRDHKKMQINHIKNNYRNTRWLQIDENQGNKVENNQKQVQNNNKLTKNDPTKQWQRLEMRPKMTTTRLKTTEWRCKTTTRRIKTTTLTQKGPQRDSKRVQQLHLSSHNLTLYITKSTGKFRGRLQCSALLKSCLTDSVYKLYRHQLPAWLTGLVSGIKIYCVANVFRLICGQYCLEMSHSGLLGNFGCSGGAERRDDFPTTSPSRRLRFKINL